MKRHFTTLILTIAYLLAVFVAIYTYDTYPTHKNKPTEVKQKTELVLYDWSQINILTAEPKLDAILSKHREWIKNRLAKGAPYTWDNFVLPIDEMNDELNQFWLPINHLTEVMKPEESLREKSEAVFSRCQEKITRYGTEFSQNKALFDAYKEVNDVPNSGLSSDQKMALANTLRDYRLSGIDLPLDKQQELAKIFIEAGKLSKKFEDNATYSAAAWKKLVTDESVLAGIPESVKLAAKKNAEEQKMKGYLLDLGDDTVSTIISFAKNRDLREEVSRALYAEASANGPGGKQFNNTPLIDRILTLRYEEARLLGFNNYAERALATRMATNTTEVTSFLESLKERSRPFAEIQYKELSEFALKKDGLKKLEAWDIAYYQQIMRNEKFSFSAETMRPYFPFTKVMSGLSEVANKLYGITLHERTDVSKWNKDVKFYEVHEADGTLVGGIYLDLFQRKEKMSGGWANSMVQRYQKSDGTIQLPVGLIVMNFRPPTGDEETLLSFQDVLYLFHEFGHNTQKLLTKVNVLDVSGTNGVPWDGIELPSQFMENFVWQPEVLDMISSHYKTGEKLPLSLVEKAREVRMLGKGMSTTRSLVADMYDFRLNIEYKPGQTELSARLFSEIYKSTAMTTLYPWMETYPNSFLHIFAGGYAAGYYSYHWAEVLAADDFSAFVKNGKIDWSVGKKFKDEILSRGGSRPFMESNDAFLGRKPTVDALMRQYGFVK